MLKESEINKYLSKLPFRKCTWNKHKTEYVFTVTLLNSRNHNSNMLICIRKEVLLANLDNNW